MADIVATDDVLDYLLTLVLPSGTVMRDARPISAESLTDYVEVGSDGDLDSEETIAGSSDLTLASFEESTRDEAGQVILAVVCQSGRSDTGDLAAARAGSLATLHELRTLLAADPKLGGAVSACWFSGIATIQGRRSQGAFCRRVVTLSFEVLQ